MRDKRILVVEDEADIQELVAFNLRKEGYGVMTADTGEEGLRLAQRELPDLVVLDLMLPGMDGLEICKALKADPKTERIAVVMLTAKGEESDIVIGLELGADDYMPKPFSPKILLARIRAVLRRYEPMQEAELADPTTTISVHNMLIHPGRREVLVDNEPVNLTATEFGLIYFLAKRPGWVFTRYQILEAVRGQDAIVTDRAVDVQIVGLRKKLGSAGQYVETVRGVGYRFKE